MKIYLKEEDVDLYLDTNNRNSIEYVPFVYIATPGHDFDNVGDAKNFL